MSGAAHELSVTCLIEAPREICWKVWTDLKDEWFCPKPWRAEVIEGVGHLVHMEATDMFNTLTLEFLNTH